MFLKNANSQSEFTFKVNSEGLNLSSDDNQLSQHVQKIITDCFLKQFIHLNNNQIP